ncbi:hypothetical protein D1609_18230 [Leptospira borgpetersenii serovar Hardjo-bovis]|nr:hypothetical protein B9T54_18340 [Leptospira borgpetersenii serovar Hardjo-bovis]AYR10306.1 hypothetical protein D1609_18230 [Leptospira borgpetersenii serovar Hardjo-bovis]TQE53914.1 hypothetical protein FFZ95_05930 [Leptospira borgpetersenii]
MRKKIYCSGWGAISEPDPTLDPDPVSEFPPTLVFVSLPELEPPALIFVLPPVEDPELSLEPELPTFALAFVSLPELELLFDPDPVGETESLEELFPDE